MRDVESHPTTSPARDDAHAAGGAPKAVALRLESASPTVSVDLGAGTTFAMRVGHVLKTIGGYTFQMLAYNGSVPGPTLRVTQGSQVFVNVTNETDMETTIHWHGLRLENPFDGVPHETQAPIPPGGDYSYRLTFPDPGLYWYHPHIREDYAQELGLYGNILVEPADSSYWPAADRDIVLTLDDILIEDGSIAAFDPAGANYTAMGRFGNVLLVGGETEQHFALRRGDVARLLLTNTANTRVFKVGLPGARLKLLGSDSGRYEREEWIDHVVIAPSERAIVDVLFEAAGTFTLQHLTPAHVYALATFTVADGITSSGRGDAFHHLRVNPDMVRERERVAPYMQAPPDKTLALVAEMDFEEPNAPGPVIYVCPMHPEVMRKEAGACPLCGMKLMPQAAEDAAATDAAPTAVPEHDHDHGDAMADGIEWEDLMPDVNRRTNVANMRWKLIDRETAAENGAIRWSFRQGDQVKIRLVNEMASDHPMHHPFHIHGERFLVLTRNGVPEPNLAWKDTVLLRTGETVDILVDAANPGLWMAHCHIAEHLETGMMFSFWVRPSES